MGEFSAPALRVFDLCIAKAVQARQMRRDTQNRMKRKPPPTAPPMITLRFTARTQH